MKGVVPMRTQKHRAVRYDHDRRYFSLHSIDSHTCDPDQGTQVKAKKEITAQQPT